MARCKAKVSAPVPEIRLRRYVHGRVVPATTIEHDPTRFLMGRGATACSTHGLPQRIKVIGHENSVSTANGAKQRPTRRNANLETQS
jgi:hypothetical protein